MSTSLIIDTDNSALLKDQSPANKEELMHRTVSTHLSVYV